MDGFGAPSNLQQVEVGSDVVDVDPCLFSMDFWKVQGEVYPKPVHLMAKNQMVSLEYLEFFLDLVKLYQIVTFHPPKMMPFSDNRPPLPTSKATQLGQASPNIPRHRKDMLTG